MKLEEVLFNPRNIILHFVSPLGPLWMQVSMLSPLKTDHHLLRSSQLQPLTHTVAQVYSQGEWENSVCQVNKEVKSSIYRSCSLSSDTVLFQKDARAFKVGLAIDFGSYVLVFSTLDGLYAVGCQCFPFTHKFLISCDFSHIIPLHAKVYQDSIWTFSRITRTF